jgi:hypothetical protein
MHSASGLDAISSRAIVNRLNVREFGVLSRSLRGLNKIVRGHGSYETPIIRDRPCLFWN